MKAENLSKLKELIKMKDRTIIKNLIARKNKENMITDGDNFVYYKGKNKDICLVAHIDTVRKNARVKFIEHHGIIRNGHGILGADDRAGVYAVLKLHEEHNVPVLFTNYEEVGGKGAYALTGIMEYEEFDDTKLFIQLDRRGHDHYVTYSHLPHAVRQYAESFGLVEKWGSFSDIAILSDAYLIPSINVAIGYYNEHSVNEFLNTHQLEEAISVVSDMIECSELLEFSPITPETHYKGKAYGYDDFGFEDFSATGSTVTGDSWKQKNIMDMTDEEFYNFEIAQQERNREEDRETLHTAVSRVNKANSSLMCVDNTNGVIGNTSDLPPATITEGFVDLTDEDIDDMERRMKLDKKGKRK